MQDFETLYRENAQIVYRYLFSLARDGDLAEELTQQTFCEAFIHAGRYRGDGAMSSYLCGIAKNLWKKELARRARVNALPLDEIAEPSLAQSAEETAMGRLERDRLFRRIQALSEPMREVVSLRLAGELPFAQIGAILGKTETWARVTFYRAKQKLMEGED